jgi:hypothetical protein
MVVVQRRLLTNGFQQVVSSIYLTILLSISIEASVSNIFLSKHRNTSTQCRRCIPRLESFSYQTQHHNSRHLNSMSDKSAHRSWRGTQTSLSSCACLQFVLHKNVFLLLLREIRQRISNHDPRRILKLTVAQVFSWCT